MPSPTAKTWTLRQGRRPISMMGDGPFSDEEFEALAQPYLEYSSITMADLIANGPYEATGKVTDDA